MTEEEIRKIINDTFSENIMNNLDSSIIFKYIEGLEKENQELKNRLEEKENQQKKFIEYLKNKEKEFDMMGDAINSGVCLGILREYKEIIGGKE